MDLDWEEGGSGDWEVPVWAAPGCAELESQGLVAPGLATEVMDLVWEAKMGVQEAPEKAGSEVVKAAQGWEVPAKAGQGWAGSATAQHAKGWANPTKVGQGWAGPETEAG
mgnify:CR=1 FL=1